MGENLRINTGQNFFPETKTSFALLFSSFDYSDKSKNSDGDKGLLFSPAEARQLPDFNNLGWDKVEKVVLPKIFEDGVCLFLDTGCSGFKVFHTDRPRNKTEEVTCLFALCEKDIMDRKTLENVGKAYEETQGMSWDVFKRNLPKGLIPHVLDAHPDADRFVIVQGSYAPSSGTVVPLSFADVVLRPTTGDVFYAKRPELVGQSGPDPKGAVFC